jgi:DNA-binding MarR family transcriptional regulator
MTDTCPARHLVPLIIADIYQLAGAFRDHGENIARGIGQSQARWQVLSAASAEPKTVPQIARRLGVTRQAVQRLANELVSDQLARFETNPDHQASPHLVLSESGVNALAQLSKAGRVFHTRVAATLSATEMARLHQGLRRLVAAVDQVTSDK